MHIVRKHFSRIRCIQLKSKIVFIKHCSLKNDFQQKVLEVEWRKYKKRLKSTFINFRALKFSNWKPFQSHVSRATWCCDVSKETKVDENLYIATCITTLFNLTAILYLPFVENYPAGRGTTANLLFKWKLVNVWQTVKDCIIVYWEVIERMWCR